MIQKLPMNLIKSLYTLTQVDTNGPEGRLKVTLIWPYLFDISTRVKKKSEFLACCPDFPESWGKQKNCNCEKS